MHLWAYIDQTPLQKSTRRPVQNSSVLPGCLKGLGHQMNIFLKANKIKSVLLYMHKVPACFFEIKFLFQLFFAPIGWFSTCGHSWPIFETILKDHRRVWVSRNKLPEEGYWLLERFSQFVSDIIEKGRNFVYYFHHRKTAKYCENHQCSFKKYLRLCSRPTNKNIHLVTLSL